MLLPAALGALLSLIPLLYLVARTLDAGGAAWDLLFRVKTFWVVVNSLTLAGAVAISATAIAVPLAWLTSRTDLPGRTFWGSVAALPLVIPSYIGAVVVVAAFGPRGMLQSALEPWGVVRLPTIYGFTGALLADVDTVHLPLRLSPGAGGLAQPRPLWRKRHAVSGMDHCGLFRRLTLPQIRPAAVAGALLTVLYTLGDFGVVTLLRYDAFTRAIYVQYRSALDRGAAAVLALLLVALSVVVLVIETRVRGSAAIHRLGSGAARRGKPVRLGRGKLPALIYCGLVAGFALVLPVAVLSGWFVRSLATAAELSALPAATAHSLTLGFWTALIATLCALPIATLAVRYGGPVVRLVERLTYLGYALPGLVVALAFVAFGAGTPLYQTVAMLVVACVVRFLPEAIASTRSALLQINPRLEEAARGLGRSSAGAVASVTVPLAKPGILAGAALVLLTAMKELPATLLLSPTGWNTLAVDVWTAANDAAYGRAAAPALILIAVAALPMLFLAPRERTGRRPRHDRREATSPARRQHERR